MKTKQSLYLIRPQYLFVVYAIVPLIGLLVIADQWLLGRQIQKTLVQNPSETLWYVILFGAPHIVASTIAYFDKEYCRHYSTKLVFGITGAFAIACVTMFYLPRTYAFLLLICITMIHLVGQQTGISRMLLRQPVANFRLWHWSTVVISCVVAAAVGFENGEDYLRYLPYAHSMLLAYIAFTSWLTVSIVMQVKLKRRAAYLICTQAMSVVVVLMLLAGYPFFVVLVPRLVHDFTAFIFYTTHDANRLQHSNGNVLYRILWLKPRYLLLGLPMIAITLALVFNVLFHPIVILTITYFHYYIEGVAWKTDTIHRQYIELRV